MPTCSLSSLLLFRALFSLKHLFHELFPYFPLNVHFLSYSCVIYFYFYTRLLLLLGRRDTFTIHIMLFSLVSTKTSTNTERPQCLRKDKDNINLLNQQVCTIKVVSKKKKRCFSHIRGKQALKCNEKNKSKKAQ